MLFLQDPLGSCKGNDSVIQSWSSFLELFDNPQQRQRIPVISSGQQASLLGMFTGRCHRATTERNTGIETKREKKIKIRLYLDLVIILKKVSKKAAIKELPQKQTKTQKWFLTTSLCQHYKNSFVLNLCASLHNTDHHTRFPPPNWALWSRTNRSFLCSSHVRPHM